MIKSNTDMKKFFFLVFFLATSLLAPADIVEIDGINYSFNSKFATVVSGSYEGDVVIPASVTYDGVEYDVREIDNAFGKKTGITSLTIPNSIKRINDWFFSSFYGNSMTAVYITDLAAWCNIEFIGYQSNPLMFANHLYVGDEEVTDLVIPDGVTEISNWAFSGCLGLLSLTVGKGVTTIGQGAFWSCSKLTSATIGGNVTSIGFNAFYNCQGLKSVKFLPCEANTENGTSSSANDMTMIREEAFYGCKNLTSIYFGNRPLRFSKDAYKGCDALTSVHITDISSWCKSSIYNISDGPLMRAHHLYYGEEEINDLVIPDDVTSISDLVFAGCHNLSSVTIGDNVKEIGQDAFHVCGMNSVIIGNGNTNIGSNAFSQCSSLKDVTIGDGADIGIYAFLSCSNLTTVTIGSGIETIGMKAFQNCTNLTDFYSHSEDVPFVGDDAFENAYIEYATLHVPASALEAYKEAEPWKYFGKIVPMGQSEPDGIHDVTTASSQPVVTKSIDGTLIIQCPINDCNIQLFDMAGRLLVSGRLINGVGRINTSLQKGDIAIVKIGEKSFKTLVR